MHNIMAKNLTGDWESCEIFGYIVVGLSLSFINLIGIFVNIIAIIALFLDKVKNSTTCMLIGLEIADTLFLISHSVVLSYIDLFRYSAKLANRKISPLDTYGYIDISQKIFSPILTGSMMASSWHMIIITIERYIAVCYPHLSSKITRRNTLVAQAIIYVFAYSINITRSWEYEPEYIEDKGYWIVSPTDLKKRKSYATYVTIQYWVIQLATPIISVITMTGLIFKVVYS